MFYLTLELKKEDGTFSFLTRRYADDVADEVLQEAVIEIKNKLTE